MVPIILDEFESPIPVNEENLRYNNGIIELNGSNILIVLDDVRKRKKILEDLEERLVDLGSQQKSLDEAKLRGDGYKSSWTESLGKIYLDSGFIDNLGLQKILNSDNFEGITKRLLEVYNLTISFMRVRELPIRNMDAVKGDRTKSSNLLGQNLVEFFNNKIYTEMKEYGMKKNFIHE